MVCDIKNMCKNHLRHAVRTVSRNIGYHDATTTRSLRIHNIIASRKHTNVTRICECVYRRGIKDRLVGQHYFGIAYMSEHVILVSTRIYRQRTELLYLFP